MSVESRLESLKRTHSALHDEITDLEAIPSADNLEIQALKRKKLSLKDNIAALEAQIT